MEYLLLSFFAGILTILAPCVLPLLPIIIGGSLADQNKLRPWIITGSLALSIVLFTLMLKATTAFIVIPPSFWKWFSGGIIIFFAITLLFPQAWETLSAKFKLGGMSQGWLAKGSQNKGLLGMIFIGAALGPVFASCSPTYFLILATVLPANFFVGLLNLVLYALGLSLMMGVIAVFGQKAIGRFKGLADPKSMFKKGLGICFLLVGFSILTGFDKKIEAQVLDLGWFGALELEQRLLDRFE